MKRGQKRTLQREMPYRTESKIAREFFIKKWPLVELAKAEIDSLPFYFSLNETAAV